MPSLAELLESHFQEKSTKRKMLLPPPCFTEMNGEYVSFTENRILVCRFPNDPRFQNPIGLMQGGFIVAAIDNTLGPLSYLVAPPSVTTQLNTTYLRPVTMRDTYLDVHGEVLEQSKSYLHMRATVLNPSGKKIALAFSTNQILST
ncbi:MAG TPA: PaaI family thioesterase [Rhodothermales bacterium]|nr:PaaI family thioesterase [Rhodothermales bacterium]